MRANAARLVMGNQGGAAVFSPASLPNLAAWFKFNTGITVTGSGVSQWNDQSGNGRHLLQGVDGSRPPQQADKTILFDGVADFLKTNAFALAQPFTVYLRFKQVAWTIADRIFDCNVDNCKLHQVTGSPTVGLNAGAVGPSSNALTVNVYGSVASVFNGASSVLQIDSTSVTGDAGANTLTAFTVGATSAGVGSANIQVAEIILYAAAHSADFRNRVIAYLNTIR